MNIKNSKAIKLKKDQKALKFWREKGEWYIMGNAFLSTIPFAFATSINMGLGFSIFAWAYLWSSIASICVHMLYGKEKMLNKIKEIDQELLNLTKTNKQEFEILREYDKIETLEKEIKGKEREIENQKRIIENMIEINCLKEKERLTKLQSKEDNKQIKKQVEELEQENKNIIDGNEI